MATGAYSKTAAVDGGVTDILAAQYNSTMASLKAAAEGIPTHDVDIVIAYTGFKINTITITDNSPAGDAGFDITLVGTAAYTGFKLTSIAWVFNAAEMNITQTEAFGYTGFKLVSIGRTLT